MLSILIFKVREYASLRNKAHTIKAQKYEKKVTHRSVYNLYFYFKLMQKYIIQIYLVSFTYYEETFLYYQQAGMQVKLFFINYL